MRLSLLALVLLSACSMRGAGPAAARVDEAAIRGATVATWRGIDAFTWMQHDGKRRIVSLAYTDEPGGSRGAP